MIHLEHFNWSFQVVVNWILFQSLNFSFRISVHLSNLFLCRAALKLLLSRQYVLCGRDISLDLKFLWETHYCCPLSRQLCSWTGKMFGAIPPLKNHCPGRCYHAMPSPPATTREVYNCYGLRLYKAYARSTYALAQAVARYWPLQLLLPEY